MPPSVAAATTLCRPCSRAHSLVLITLEQRVGEMPVTALAAVPGRLGRLQLPKRSGARMMMTAAEEGKVGDAREAAHDLGSQLNQQLGYADPGGKDSKA